jgi:diguanylate cyclase (GGDEF)-like protein
LSLRSRLTLALVVVALGAPALVLVGQALVGWPAALILVAAVVTASALIAHALSAPVHDLAERAREVARGDLGRPVSGGGDNCREVDELAGAIDALRTALQEARRASMTDEMTGIWNYRYFRLRLDEEIQRSRRFQHPLSLLLLDLDRFKEANDRYGHQHGDSILRELARRVAGSIRDVDTFARYGGEEFVLILPETDATGAMVVAEKLRNEIGVRPFQGGPGSAKVTVTVSIGVACHPMNGDTAVALIRAADIALYRAKAAGRDRVVLAARS